MIGMNIIIITQVNLRIESLAGFFMMLYRPINVNKIPTGINKYKAITIKYEC